MIIIFACYSAIAVYAPGEKALFIAREMPVNPYLKLFEAVCWVESNNNPLAYNARENACGIAQIRKIRLDDYNNRTHRSYSLRQVYDPKISKTIFMFYADKIGYNNFPRIAMSWNGSGKETINYWHRVKKRLKSV
jgi:hypothetical protein